MPCYGRSSSSIFLNLVAGLLSLLMSRGTVLLALQFPPSDANQLFHHVLGLWLRLGEESVRSIVPLVLCPCNLLTVNRVLYHVSRGLRCSVARASSSSLVEVHQCYASLAAQGQHELTSFSISDLSRCCDY